MQTIEEHKAYTQQLEAEVGTRNPLENPAEHNRRRASLPEQCWLCVYYDRCSPTHKCRHQVDIDVQAQLPTK